MTVLECISRDNALPPRDDPGESTEPVPAAVPRSPIEPVPAAEPGVPSEPVLAAEPGSPREPVLAAVPGSPVPVSINEEVPMETGR